MSLIIIDEFFFRISDYSIHTIAWKLNFYSLNRVWLPSNTCYEEAATIYNIRYYV